MYQVVYPGGITLRSEPKFDAKIPGRVAKRGDVVEPKEVIGSSWVRLRDNTYLPLIGPSRETLLARVTKSDDQTTQYMERFKDGLDSFSIEGAADDAFIQQYTNKATSKLLNHVPTLVSEASYRASESSSGISASSISVQSKLNVSERNVLCMSLNGDEAVVGAADHALYAVNLTRNKISRKLYTKTAGHTEWVTCVTHELSTGRVISGGMDGKLCVWDGVVARELRGHLGSISQVRENSSVLFSSSYDRSLKCWDLRRRELLADFQGHKGAVIDFCLNGDSMLSCGRDSLAILWDVKAAAQRRKFKDHVGHVTCGILRDDFASTGAQDGKVRLWDFRANAPQLVLDFHRKGAAVTGLEITGQKLISCGADGRVNVSDLRSHETSLSQWEGDHGNFIYSMRLVDGDVLTGGGDGKIVRRSLDGTRKWSVQCETNAIRCMEQWKSRLIVAGDDGNLVVLN